MREHEDCEEAIFTAMSKREPGHAEYLAARCDLKHGAQLPAPPTVHPTREPAKETA